MNKKVNRKQELFGNTIIVGIGNIINSAISFLLVPLLTIWLTPKQYGEYDLLYSYIALLSPFITLQLDQAILRFTLENKENGPKYFHICMTIVLFNSALTMIVFGGLCTFSFHLVFAFSTVAFALQTFSIEYLRGCNKLKQYSLANILSGIFTLLNVFLFVKVLDCGTNGILFGYGLAYLTISVSIIIREKLYKNIVVLSKQNEDKELLKGLFLYSLPLLPNAVSWWITNVSDRTLIRIFMGSYYNGIYAVSCKIPTLITVFYGTFNLAWQQSAILSSKDDLDNRKLFYNSIFSHLVQFLFSSAFVIVAVTPILYRLFLNVRYNDGMVIIPLLILATTILNLSQYLGGILLGMKDTKTNGFTTVVAAIVNFFVDLFLIQKIGLYAAAISTLVGYCFMLLLRLRKVSNLFNISKVLVIILIGSILVGLESIVVLYTKQPVMQWFILILTICLFLLMNKRIVSSLFHMISKKSN